MVAITSIDATLGFSTETVIGSAVVSADPVTSTGSKSLAITRTVNAPSGTRDNVKRPTLSESVDSPVSSNSTEAPAIGKPSGPVSSPLTTRPCKDTAKTRTAGARYRERLASELVPGIPLMVQKSKANKGP